MTATGRRFEISKDFKFSASHRLDGLPDDHQCARLHGHNYVIRVHVGADALDAVGFVVDFAALAPVGAWIDEQLDHRHLNDVLAINPTSEHMGQVFAEHAALVLTVAGFTVADDDRPTLRDPARVLSIAVSVSETPTSWSTYVLAGVPRA